VIAIALSKVLYFWSNKHKDNNVTKVSELMDNAFYCSVKWNPVGAIIGTGSDVGMLEVIDAAKPVCLWSVECHANRVSSMSWMSPHVISTGSRDNTIKTMDLRTKQIVSVLQKHTQEVCGLKWSPNGIHLASGGNDNIINIWDQRR
jgi:WD40 repeat protein